MSLKNSLLWSFSTFILSLNATPTFSAPLLSQHQYQLHSTTEKKGDMGEQEYLDHARVEVKEFTSKDLPLVVPSVSVRPNDKFNPQVITDFLNAFSQVLVFGEKIWKIVHDNAAVLNVDTNRAISVLPNVLNQSVTPMDLENWQLPKSGLYHFTGYSNLGNVLAEMTYTVNFSYGGSYGGKGRYLTGVDIVPNKVYVKWSNKFDVKSELKSVINLGTKENPVVAATLEVTYRLTTPFSTRLMTDVITVVGDGQLVTPASNNAVGAKDEIEKEETDSNAESSSLEFEALI